MSYVCGPPVTTVWVQLPPHGTPQEHHHYSHQENPRSWDQVGHLVSKLESFTLWPDPLHRIEECEHTTCRFSWQLQSPRPQYHHHPPPRIYRPSSESFLNFQKFLPQTSIIGFLSQSMKYITKLAGGEFLFTYVNSKSWQNVIKFYFKGKYNLWDHFSRPIRS